MLPIHRAAAATALCAVLVSTTVSAQTNSELNAGLQLNLATPGARSLALGGAFIGLADDATSAFANPAGLTTLSEKEASVEGRSTTSETRFPNGGNTRGETIPGSPRFSGPLQFDEEENQEGGMAYVSYVQPVRVGSRPASASPLRLALYRHELVRFRASATAFGAVFDRIIATAPPAARRRQGIGFGDLDLDVVSYGASGAVRLFDRLSFGAGVALFTFDLDQRGVGYQTEPKDLLAEPDLSGDNTNGITVQRGEDSGVGFNLGVLFELVRSRSIKLGAAYRHNPEFDFEYEFLCGKQTESDPADRFNCDVLAEELSGRTEFSLPHVLGFGVSARPVRSLLLSFEYDRVEYSRLRPKVNVSQAVLVNASAPGVGGLAAELDRFHVDDADEVHFGAEYTVVGPRVFAFRVGAWHETFHDLYYSGLIVPVSLRYPGYATEIGPDGRLEVRNRKEGTWHYALGLGVVLSDRFEVNAGFDLADRDDDVRLGASSLSAVVRF